MTDTTDYKVGYKQPPREHRFKPGRSGNPKGRRKGSRSLGEEVRAALGTRIAITEGGEKRSITALTAALRRLVERAVKGDVKAIMHLLTLADGYPAEQLDDGAPPDDLALIESALRRQIPSSRGEGGE